MLIILIVSLLSQWNIQYTSHHIWRGVNPYEGSCLMAVPE